jgi:hypothetical protein
MVVWSLEGYDLIVTKEGRVFVFEVSSCSSKCLAIVTKKFQWWVKGPPSKDEWQRPPCSTANMCFYMLHKCCIWSYNWFLFQAHLRPEEIETTSIPSPMGGCSLHQVRDLQIAGAMLTCSAQAFSFSNFCSVVRLVLHCS